MSASSPRAGLVSVVTPFLDPRPEFLLAAVESVRAQTHASWELLLVDDGSRPEAGVLARELAERHPTRIRYLEHEGHRNLGHSAARNLGIRHARGEFLALLDADDLWLPRKLEEQIAILRANPRAGMVYGPTLYWFGWTGRPEDQALDYTPALGVPPDTLLPPPSLVARMIRGDVSVPCTCSLLVRRSIVDEVGGFEEAFTGLFEDQVFYVKVSLRASVYVTPGSWDRYRRHPESLCATASPEEGAAGRRTFLEWVRRYVRDAGADDGSVEAAVGRGLWELDHPSAARILRSARRARRLAGRWLAG